VEYDPQWTRIFEEEKQRILKVIENKVFTIKHVGSTAVPGLAAKPIIDIMAGVEGIVEANWCIPRLKKIGYTSFTPDLETLDHYYCCGKGPHSIGYHLHLIRFESSEWYKHLLFRDYLRSHPITAQQYYKLKTKLATKYYSNRGSYTKSKTAFIESVIAKAHKEP
jgi:GrpB-like predicted nucleotidyltransferase (UPF0157 family)